MLTLTFQKTTLAAGWRMEGWKQRDPSADGWAGLERWKHGLGGGPRDAGKSIYLR